MSITTNTPATTNQVPLQSPIGNVQAEYLINVTLSPALVPTAAGGNEQTFPVTGILAGDFVRVSKPTNQAGLGIGNVRTTAGNVIIGFTNASGSDITPTASQVYTLLVSRPMASAVIDGFPTSLPTP